jgi:hypothetical protein
MKKVLMIALLLINTVYADSTLCSANDEVVFSCDIKQKKLSVCKHKNRKQVIYRYGTPYKVELEIRSKPFFSSEQFVRANYENHLRFHNKGYDYIVYSNEFLEYDRHPNDGTAHYVEHHGVYVAKENRLLVKLTCNKVYSRMLGIESVASSVFDESYNSY